jgi:hypothetical protein
MCGDAGDAGGGGGGDAGDGDGDDDDDDDYHDDACSFCLLIGSTRSSACVAATSNSASNIWSCI